jgi:hypothetical protein
MTPEDATAWSLARLNTLFFHHYDRREYDEVLDLFTPDARYEVHGQKLRGHAEILDVLNARPGPELTARHLNGEGGAVARRRGCARVPVRNVSPDPNGVDHDGFA